MSGFLEGKYGDLLSFESSASTSFTTPAAELNNYSDAWFAVSMLISKAHSARRRRETTRRNGDTETRRGGQKTEGFLSVVRGPWSVARKA